jgi:hypothetical protein
VWVVNPSEVEGLTGTSVEEIARGRSDAWVVSRIWMIVGGALFEEMELM